MFSLNSGKGYTEILKGIQIKTINYGNKMLMSEFLLKKNTLLPKHSHSQEQSGYLVKGCIKLFINSTSKLLKPGDSWCITENIEHYAEIIEDSIAIEVFSPIREDYLKYLNREDIIQ
jgi:quercetin dioxygenase-like cupin family protein